MSRTTTIRTDITPMKTISLSDPSSSAITQTIINDNSGVVVTTTTTGSSITLASPSNLTEYKRFSVANNDTSTHTVTVNGMPISPNTVKYFIWDGTSWTLDVGNIIGQSTINPSINMFLAPYSTNSGAISTGAGTADLMEWIPFRTQQEHTFVSIALGYTVGVASNSIALGLYESDERGLPTNQLAYSGHLTATTGGGATVTYTFPTPIVCGINKVYWVAMANNQPGTTLRKFAANNVYTRLGLNGSGSSTPITRLTSVLTPGWTTFPNPAPATGSYTYTGGAVPAILLEHKV